MGRIVYVPWTGTVTNAGGNSDLWELTPADDKPIKLVSLILGNISEVGDAAEEGLEITVKRLRATVTSGSGGSAAVPEVPDSADDAAVGLTAEFNNTTVATTSGATDVLAEIGWNIRNTPAQIDWPVDKMQPKAKQGEVIVIRMETTPADDFTFVGTVIIDEE